MVPGRALRSRLAVPGLDAWYRHRFYRFEPDLNTDNPAVREEIRKIATFWLTLGVSGFRIDAAPFLIEPTVLVPGRFGDARGRRRIELAYSLQLTMPGTAVIRYGEEIGMGDNLDLPRYRWALPPSGCTSLFYLQLATAFAAHLRDGPRATGQYYRSARGRLAMLSMAPSTPARRRPDPARACAARKARQMHEVMPKQRPGAARTSRCADVRASQRGHACPIAMASAHSGPKEAPR